MIQSTWDPSKCPRICLLEYDDRFELLADFVKFDFNRPLDLRPDLHHVFDRVLCDPPYHSEECIIKCQSSLLPFLAYSYRDRLGDNAVATEGGYTKEQADDVHWVRYERGRDWCFLRHEGDNV